MESNIRKPSKKMFTDLFWLHEPDRVGRQVIGGMRAPNRADADCLQAHAANAPRSAPDEVHALLLPHNTPPPACGSSRSILGRLVGRRPAGLTSERPSQLQLFGRQAALPQGRRKAAPRCRPTADFAPCHNGNPFATTSIRQPRRRKLVHMRSRSAASTPCDGGVNGRENSPTQKANNFFFPLPRRRSDGSTPGAGVLANRCCGTTWPSGPTASRATRAQACSNGLAR